MINEKQLCLRSVVSADAGSGTKAEAAVVTLRRTLDKNGRVERESDDFVTLSITQSSTKEVESGVRTLVRVDRAPNGRLPKASAYLVVIGSDTVDGRESALSALLSLFTFLSNNTSAESLADTITSDYRVFIDGTEDDIDTSELTGRWARILRGEA